MIFSETDQSSFQAEKDRESRRGRFEVAVAASVLGFLSAIVAAFLYLSPDREEKEISDSKENASEKWIQDRSSRVDVKDTKADAGGQLDAGEEKQNAPLPETGDASAREGKAEQEPSSGLVTKKGTVRSGVPMTTSLTKLGLPSTEAYGIVQALDGVFDFRRARPGHVFELQFDPAKRRVEYFRYDESSVDVYEVTRRGDKLSGRKKVVPTDKKLVKIGGTVGTSLYSTIADLRLHSSLAGKVADVLSNQVNFFKEQRSGDALKVIVEEETLGDEFIKYGPILALEYQGAKVGKKRFFFFEGDRMAPLYYDEKGISVPFSVIRIPLHYTRISSLFGMRYHPILKRKLKHDGVDFSAPSGTPVWTCSPGEVLLAESRGANGNLVVVRHDDDLRSYYAHLQRFAAGIRTGKRLSDRQVLGYVGSTGRSTGPHLHFGLKKGGVFIDPLKYKIRPGRPIAQKYSASLKKVIAERSKVLDLIKIEPPSKPIVEMPETETEVLGVEELE